MSASDRATVASPGDERRPVIGITPEDRDAFGNIVLPSVYVDAVRRAGGLPVILPPWQADASALLALVDGIILAGGGDVDPNDTVAFLIPRVYAVDADRDATEIALAQAAVQQRMPFLGICRGAQIVNVALGGTLIEHLNDETGGARHRGDPPGYAPHHVDVLAGSHLARILGRTELDPLSWHHQAIRIPAAGLAVVAQSPDGVIEAVEITDHPFFVAVQWHPEMTAAVDESQQSLFDALIAAARIRARRAPAGADSRTS